MDARLLLRLLLLLLLRLLLLYGRLLPYRVYTGLLLRVIIELHVKLGELSLWTWQFGNILCTTDKLIEARNVMVCSRTLLNDIFTRFWQPLIEH